MRRFVSSLVYAGAWSAAMALALWVAVGVVGYPEPPARPASVNGTGFRVERDGQHVAVLSGEPYALGYFNAKLFPELMHLQEQTLLDELMRFAKDAGRAMLIERLSLAYLIGFSDYLSPAEQLEILGLSEGTPDPFPYLGPRYARLAGYHAIHELSHRFAFDNPLFACTLIGVGASRGVDGHAYLARNFDFEGGEVFDLDKLVLAVRPASGYGFVSVVWAGMAGVVSGINEKGLAIVLNAGASSDYRRVGTPTTLLVRRALEQAATVDEAIAVITASPAFVSDILGLADRSGQVAVIELTPRRHAVRRGEVVLATNHMESEALAQDSVNLERQGQTTTVARRQRLARLAEEHAGPWTAEDLLAVLRDRRAPDGRELPLGHRHALDALIATHSVILDATAGRLWVSAGPHTLGQYHGYDVARLLASRTPEEVEESFLPSLPADALLSQYPRVVMGRAAWRNAEAALARGDAEAAATVLARVGPLLDAHPTTLMLRARAAQAAEDSDLAVELLERALAAPVEYPVQQAKIEDELARLEQR